MATARVRVGPIAACVVFARRFAARRQPGWMSHFLTTGVAALLLCAWSGEVATITLFVTAAVGFVWVAALETRLRAELTGAGRERLPERDSGSGCGTQ